MPLPWLIGAAVVAAAAAVVKAVSDDSSSSPDSDDAERRRQEREARAERKRNGLTAQVGSLKKDRLEEARELLACAAQTLANLPRKTTGLTTSKFESSLMAKLQATSEYALGLCEIFDTLGHNQTSFTLEERSEFLVNLKILEDLYGPTPFNSELQQDLFALKELGGRLDRLQHLKQQLE